jgi:hypothetical protein
VATGGHHNLGTHGLAHRRCSSGVVRRRLRELAVALKKIQGFTVEIRVGRSRVPTVEGRTRDGTQGLEQRQRCQSLSTEGGRERARGVVGDALRGGLSCGLAVAASCCVGVGSRARPTGEGGLFFPASLRVWLCASASRRKAARAMHGQRVSQCKRGGGTEGGKAGVSGPLLCRPLSKGGPGS